MTSPSGPASARLVELDGLRCFAVLGVMAVHFSPGWLGSFGPWGEWGVRFFFVLSGFLITRLLLAARDRVGAGRSRAWPEFARFCWRRALRLWPTYLLTVLGAAAVGLDYARAMLPWNLAFAGNYFITLRDTWPQLMSHLWTLGVEQQFYVLWPLLILFARPAAITTALPVLMLAGPLMRLLEMALIPHASVHFALLPSSVDYFAWGGWLAWVLAPSGGGFRLAGRTCGWLAGLFLAACYAGDRCGATRLSPLLWPALDGTLVAVAAMLLIRHCVAPEDSAVKSLLRLAPLVYLGRISYGIYLYHNFVHWIGPGLLRRLTGERYFPREWEHLLYYVALSILIAAASWHLLEKPLEHYRRRIASPVP